MRPCFFVVLLVFAASPCVFSQSLEGLIGEENARRLRSLENSEENSISLVQTRNPSLEGNSVLLPNHAEFRKYAADSMTALSPSVVVETLYLYKKPTTSGVWTENQRLGLFNRLLAISSLSGIEYFSASRGAMRTFYESSVVIDGPNTKNPLPDPVFSQLPESFSIFARQKDLTFGDNIYQYDFITKQDAFFFAQENMTALTAGIIPAVGRNRLRAIFAVFDCGDSLLIYAVSMARVASVPGMSERIGTSFGNRAQAVYKWFTVKADDVF